MSWHVWGERRTLFILGKRERRTLFIFGGRCGDVVFQSLPPCQKNTCSFLYVTYHKHLVGTSLNRALWQGHPSFAAAPLGMAPFLPSACGGGPGSSWQAAHGAERRESMFRRGQVPDGYKQ
jgi:hypothetical protein